MAYVLFIRKETQAVHEKIGFSNFPKYAAQVEEVIRTDAIRILPEFRKKEIMNFFSEEGIKDFSVSRPKESAGWGFRCRATTVRSFMYGLMR